MSVAAPAMSLDGRFARELPELGVAWTAGDVPDARLLVLNESLAGELGLDPASLREPDGVRLLVGAQVPPGATPVAQAYAGNQFGAPTVRLGDGRALLLGELVDTAGVLHDVHLKGAGRTPFARGGDGLAAVGPMLREHVIGEAMHALGVPTTRSLAVSATGRTVTRERPLPGAVLTRVASSHLRVGTVQYARALGDRDGSDLLRRLADHAIARHHPDAGRAERPYLALLEAVTEAQAALVARWMLLGFVHGVMNTDNMTLSGETIDYGPCAFMEAYDPATVFSSIDDGGRYAYGNQPTIAQWNLTRLAEALLPVLGDSADEARELAVPVLESFPDRYLAHYSAGMRVKLGLPDGLDADVAAVLVDDLVRIMRMRRPDHTLFFRRLAAVARGADDAVPAELAELSGFDDWLTRWRAFAPDTDAMDRANPLYVPRNHLVEDALAAATDGDLRAFEQLLDVVTHPYEQRDGLERYASPAPPDFGRYVTYCGT